MKYLIQLEDRENNREVMIECPAKMILEELNVKIKSEFQLPCTDELGHWFQMNGKVYVTDENVIREMCGFYPDWYYPTDIGHQLRINYPKKRDLRDSWQYRLDQVFTVKESVIVFLQDNRNLSTQIYCTLIDRIAN